MVFAFTEYPRDDLALLGDAKSLVGTQGLNVDRPRHTAKLSALPANVQ
jgi:hypothetical protein